MEWQRCLICCVENWIEETDYYTHMHTYTVHTPAFTPTHPNTLSWMPREFKEQELAAFPLVSGRFLPHLTIYWGFYIWETGWWGCVHWNLITPLISQLIFSQLCLKAVCSCIRLLVLRNFDLHWKLHNIIIIIHTFTGLGTVDSTAHIYFLIITNPKVASIVLQKWNKMGEIWVIPFKCIRFTCFLVAELKFLARILLSLSSAAAFAVNHPAQSRTSRQMYNNTKPQFTSLQASKEFRTTCCFVLRKSILSLRMLIFANHKCYCEE